MFCFAIEINWMEWYESLVLFVESNQSRAGQDQGYQNSRRAGYRLPKYLNLQSSIVKVCVCNLNKYQPLLSSLLRQFQYVFLISSQWSSIFPLKFNLFTSAIIYKRHIFSLIDFNLPIRNYLCWNILYPSHLIHNLL